MKPPRLQFSLRMILLLTAMVGLALMIFRWPWVEEKTHSPFYVVNDLGMGNDGVRRTDGLREFEIVTRTTYHRDWRGNPSKHGLAQWFRNGELWHEENYYEGLLHGRRRVWDWQNKLAVEANYHGGLLHGEYRTAEPWKFEGQYKAGNWDGEWRGIVEQGSRPFIPHIDAFLDEVGNPNRALRDRPSLHRPVEIITNYRQGQRHGRTIWLTLDGELLNTAEYAGDDLVAWNGQPIVEQFRDWLDTIPNSSLKADLADAERSSSWRAEKEAYALRIFIPTASGERPVLQIQWENRSELHWESRGSPIAALCEFAAQEGLGFDYRYGGLCLVPREADPSPPFVDPTGVSNVRFAAGSPEQREWDAMIDVVDRHYWLLGQIRNVFHETTIQLDVSQVDLETWNFPPAVDTYFLIRSRRDALGHLLYVNGCRCEQQGNKLVIRRR